METQQNINLHCKVQYENEFRRFILSGSYADMLEQIRVLFGFKNDEEICIKYTDDEGDKVTISSDEELGFAIELFPNSVLRLTITGPAKCQRVPGPHGENWAKGNEGDKWEKMRAEKAEFWKQKKAQKAAKWEAKREGKAEKWEAKREGKAEKWEAKKDHWEAKKEKIMNDPELRREKLEHIEKKLHKLQERKQWLQSKVDENGHPGFAHRLAHINAKLNRFESFRAMLANPATTSSAPATASSAPAPAPAITSLPVDPVTPIVEPIREAPSTPVAVINVNINAAKETRGVLANELTDTQQKIQMKKKELEELRTQFTERTNAMKKELEDLRATWQEKKSAIAAQDAQIRNLRQDLLAQKTLQAQKKAQKQSK